MIQNFDLETKGFSVVLPGIIKRLTAIAESLNMLEQDEGHGLTIGVLDGHGLNVQSAANDLEVINGAL